jgi:hypothetical protein
MAAMLTRAPMPGKCKASGRINVSGWMYRDSATRKTHTSMPIVRATGSVNNRPLIKIVPGLVTALIDVFISGVKCLF